MAAKRSKGMGAIVPIAIAGGAGYLAYREGLFDRFKVRAEAGASSPANGGTPAAQPIAVASSGSQTSPTSDGSALFTPPSTATAQRAPSAPMRGAAETLADPRTLSQGGLADRLRALGRGDLAMAVMNRERPGGAGTASVGDSARDIQRAGTNTAARTLPGASALRNLAGEGIYFAAPSGGDAPLTASTTNYVIKPGDTLGAIAARFGTSVGKLATINGISNASLIRAGATIRV